MPDKDARQIKWSTAIRRHVRPLQDNCVAGDFKHLKRPAASPAPVGLQQPLLLWAEAALRVATGPDGTL